MTRLALPGKCGVRGASGCGVDHVLGGEQAFAGEQAGQAERGEAHAGAAQQLTAGEQLIEGGVR